MEPPRLFLAKFLPKNNYSALGGVLYYNKPMRSIDNKKRVIALFILWPIVATLLSFVLKTNALGSVVLFLIIPSIYLSFLLKKSVKKVLLFSLVTSVPVIIVVDYIAHATKQWLVPNSVFALRILGLIPLEDIIWAFFSVFCVVMFYEYFLEPHHETKIWRPRMNVLTAIFIGLLVVFLLCYLLAPSILLIPYAYLWMGIVVIFIPTIIEIFRKPILLPKLLVVGAYFFYLELLYELTALKLGWWLFPGSQYIGMVSLFGLQFPFEELFFWIMLFAIGILIYYEPFDDDEK